MIIKLQSQIKALKTSKTICMCFFYPSIKSVFDYSSFSEQFLHLWEGDMKQFS